MVNMVLMSRHIPTAMHATSDPIRHPEYLLGFLFRIGMAYLEAAGPELRKVRLICFLPFRAIGLWAAMKDVNILPSHVLGSAKFQRQTRSGKAGLPRGILTMFSFPRAVQE